MTRRAAIAGFGLAALAVPAMLAACAGDPPSLGGVPRSGVSTEAIAKGAAYGDPTTGSAEDSTTGFNPFDTNKDTSGGGREVIENPTLEDVALTGTLPEMSLGRADAPVTMIKYASLTCPHCREFHKTVFPELKRTYIDTGKVRFIIREFPIGRTSGTATIALRCTTPEKYFALYGKYLDQQSNWVSQDVRLDPIFAVASQVGMKRAEFDACLANQSMIDGLKWVKERGRKLGVIGTPNFFIGNRRIKSTLDMAGIRAIVDPMLAGAPAAAAAQSPPG
ncbi:MAG: DsbA family protein [Hyphomicrobium sp.]|nr:DsbA family protein [Hyphomicrobium sp.]